MTVSDTNSDAKASKDKSEKHKQPERLAQQLANPHQDLDHYRAVKSHTDKQMTGLAEHLTKTGQLPNVSLIDTGIRHAGTAVRAPSDHCPSIQRPAEGSPERHLERDTHGKEKEQQQEWTICVNLTANERNDDGSDAGGKPKLKQLQELDSKTAGKNVTIIAQSFTTNAAGERMVQRYVIKDGQCKPMYVDADGKERPVKSEGYKQDLQKLLQIANDNYPSRKIALVQQAHGMPEGRLGIENPADHQPRRLTQQDSCSIEEFRDAVRQGLRGRQLDLLDFDACHMGSSHVLNNVRGITKQVVASPETEQHNGGSGGYDGQNIGNIVSTVLQHPEFGGEQLGRAIVENANRGSNRSSVENSQNNGHEGTDTLSHYNLEKYTAYTNAVDDFGQALAEAARTPAQRELLRQIIQKTPTYPAGDTSSSTRDIKRFAELVRDAIGHGLSDPHGRLARSIESLLNSERELVADYHANRQARVETTGSYGEQPNASGQPAGYENMGGLSIYLPSRDANDRARDNTPITQIQETISLGLQHPEQTEDIKRFLSLHEQSPSLTQIFPPGSAEAAQLAQLKAAMQQARTQDCSVSSLTALNKVLESLKGSKLEAAFRATALEQARKVMRKQFEENCDPNEQGWGRFLQTMGLAG